MLLQATTTRPRPAGRAGTATGRKSARTACCCAATRSTPGAEQYGSIALAVLDGQDGQDASLRTGWADRTWGDSLLDFWDDFSADATSRQCASISAAGSTNAPASP